MNIYNFRKLFQKLHIGYRIGTIWDENNKQGLGFYFDGGHFEFDINGNFKKFVDW